MQKERQEKQEKEEEEKKEKQRQEAEEMVRRIHEGTDSIEEQLATVTDQQETKPSEESSSRENASEVVGENVEVDGVDTSMTDAANKGAKTGTSSSSEEIDEEVLEGEEAISKIGKDGRLYN